MKQQFTTRIEQDIMDKVKSIAEIERRTLNNTIEYLLAEGIKIYEIERELAERAKKQSL